MHISLRDHLWYCVTATGRGFFCLFSFNWTFPSNDQIAYYISQFLKKSKRNKGLQQQQTLQLNQAVEQSCVVLFWVTQISAFKLFQKCWHFHATLCIPSKMLAQLAHRPWTQQTARWRVGFRTSLLYLEFVSKLSTLTSWCSGRPPRLYCGKLDVTQVWESASESQNVLQPKQHLQRGIATLWTPELCRVYQHSSPVYANPPPPSHL